MTRKPERGIFILNRRLPPRDPYKCPRCGSKEFRDVSIHNGKSIRQDCAACGAFVKFVRWYGKAIDTARDDPASIPREIKPESEPR